MFHSIQNSNAFWLIQSTTLFFVDIFFRKAEKKTKMIMSLKRDAAKLFQMNVKHEALFGGRY